METTDKARTSNDEATDIKTLVSLSSSSALIAIILNLTMYAIGVIKNGIMDSIRDISNKFNSCMISPQYSE